MDSYVIWICTLTTIIPFVAESSCSPIDPAHDGTDIPKRCCDVPQAVDYLHRYLPFEMPIEEKCRRYAIVSDIVKTKRVPHINDLIRVLELAEEPLNDRYQRLNLEDLIEFYMRVIDSYRASQLRPPMLEIVECLRRFGTPAVETFLSKPELVLILDLYRRVLDSPEQTIDLNNIDLDQYNAAFSESVKILFGEFGGQQGSYAADSGSRYNANSDDDFEDRLSHVLSQPMTEEQREKALHDLRRERERRRQRIARRQKPYRHREQERLRKQRNRILRPDALREKDRTRQLRRTGRLREEQLVQEVIRHTQEQQQQQELFAIATLIE